jgi:hypothetical protein
VYMEMKVFFINMCNVMPSYLPSCMVKEVSSSAHKCTYYNLDGPEPLFVNLLRSPGVDYQIGGPLRQPSLTYRLARLHRLVESIPWNRFHGSLNVYKFGLRRGSSIFPGHKL